MTHKILVTGASGHIGKPLVQALQDAGATFAVLRSQPTPDAALETRVADFADPAALTRAFAGINTLFVLLPLVPNKLDLARNVAAAAKAAGVKHIVRSSGAGADAASPFALPRLQGQIDDVLAATGIPCTFLRPAGFMQNYATYQAQAIKDGRIHMADNGQAQSLIDVRDIAAVAATVLLAPTAHAGQAYTLTGSESFTGAQAATQISSALGREVQHVSVPVEAAVATMQQWGMPPFIVEVMDSLNRIVSAGYAGAVSPDTERLLGRRARSFAAFVAEQAPHWK
jgi:uncharacterized protein YbjT (DUF2867 family)